MPNRTIAHSITPKDALQLLREGNFRFVNNLAINHDMLELVNATKDDQWPFAAILSCMDSRTAAEVVFNLGLGDIFSVRIGGNVISPNVLGSLEYAVAVAGSKLILVLGHTGCGAVRGACDNVKLGHITTLLEHIHPAVEEESTIKENRNGSNPGFVNAVARINVRNTVQEMIRESSIIRDMAAKGEIGIVPAMYDVATGLVTFFEDEALLKVATANHDAAKDVLPK